MKTSPDVDLLPNVSFVFLRNTFERLYLLSTLITSNETVYVDVEQMCGLLMYILSDLTAFRYANRTEYA